MSTLPLPPTPDRADAAPRRVLIITTGQLLAPSSGGELRTRRLAEALARQGHQVHVLALVARNYLAGQATPGERLTIEQRHCVWLDLALVADRLRLIPITELPQWLRPLSGVIRRRAASLRAEVVQFDFPWFALIQPRLSGVRVVYNAQNIESQWWAPRLRAWPFGERFIARLRRYELLAMQSAQAVAACTAADRDWILAEAGLPAARVGLCPNGYDAHRLHRPSAAERAQARARLGLKAEEKVIVFIGSRAHPNVQAAQAIIHQIMPADVNPSHRYVIVGGAGEAVRSVAQNNSRLTVTGPVEDVWPWLAAADVALNPMASGSGSNLKLAEYCAAGVAVVTTPFGLRGFDELAPWLTVCEIGEFASVVEQAAAPNQIPEAVQAHYSWDESARRLATLYGDDGRVTRQADTSA